MSTGKAAEKDQEYDQFIRELVFDKRARPKDRLKTEEELALEEKQKLEREERRRRRRMNGEDDASSSSEDEGRSRKRKREKEKERGGDDLEDDFMLEVGGGLGAGLEEEEESGLEESDKQETSEGGSGEDAGSWGRAPSGMRRGPIVLEEDSQEEEDLDEPASKRRRTTSMKAAELPFTFPCPSTHDEFLDIVEGVADNDVPTVVQRIRALYHPSLGVENKYKLQVNT